MTLSTDTRSIVLPLRLRTVIAMCVNTAMELVRQNNHT
jgi:hypothetical protein